MEMCCQVCCISNHTIPQVNFLLRQLASMVATPTVTITGTDKKQSCLNNNKL